MDVDLELSGRRVLVVGSDRGTRHVVARVQKAGGTVSLSSPPAEAATSRTAWSAALAGIDLVVLVELDEPGQATLRHVCREASVWIVREEPSQISGRGTVTLVGAGPGDAGLMTLAGRRALRMADLVLFDRLAPHERLREWAPDAELVDVGKTPGHHAVPQSEIERLMVEAALAGRTVVRLKGGDPFVFGRGGEEVAACRAASVPVSVISGVTSAIAVPAAAGIPVTHRETSRMFTVVSGHAPLEDDVLAHLIAIGGTIVVLMGVGTLPQLAAGLMRQGAARVTPVAIVERGLTADQRTTITSLADATQVASRLGVRSPAVIVIGDVVRLHSASDAPAADWLADVAASVVG